MLDLFQQAVNTDPNFALGHAWMAVTYRDMATIGSMPQAEAFEKAKEAAQKALSLDDSLAEAHAVLGLILFEHNWEFARAEKEYRRAMELAPDGLAGSILLLPYMVCTGRFDEALALQKRNAEANPLDPSTAAWIFYMARRFDEAIADATKFLDLNPNVWGIRAVRSNCYSMKEMWAEALTESEKVLSSFASVASDPNLLIALACNYARCGDRKKAEELIEALKKTGYIDQDPACQAVIYISLGEKDLAMAA